MTYEVIISQHAINQLDAAHDWIAQQSPQHAPEWYNGMIDALASLSQNPGRCPKVDPDGDLRYLLVGDKRHSYRIAFKIQNSIVRIYSIRHAARQS
jgi:plasmid stabilization system protein ParE